MMGAIQDPIIVVIVGAIQKVNEAERGLASNSEKRLLEPNDGLMIGTIQASNMVAIMGAVWD